jgi:hypothetical protein
VSEVPEGTVPVPDDDPAFERAMFKADGGELSQPWCLVAALIDEVGVPLERLVTPESLGRWNLQEVRALLAGYGMSTMTRYLNPTWAEIRLVPARSSSYVATQDAPVPQGTLGAYVRFDEGRGWRLHAIGPPGLPVEELP